MLSIAKKSVEIGLKEICFTDHLEYAVAGSTWTVDALVDFGNYKAEISSLKKQFSSVLDIKCGIEIGMHPDTIDKLRDYMKDVELDFIMCSLHEIEPAGHQAVAKYLKTMLHCIKKAPHFSVVGHLDFFKRYISYDDEKIFKANFEILESILKTIIDKGSGIEVNTSGFRYGLGQPLPSRDILTLYKDLGGEIITTGSDAHKLCDLGHNFEYTYDLLKDIGFKYVTTFDNMEPIFIKI